MNQINILPGFLDFYRVLPTKIFGNAVEKLMFTHYRGRGVRLSDCICRAKSKTPIFENEQFSGHFVLHKIRFFLAGGGGDFFTPIHKNFVFFWKKKCFFQSLIIKY